MFCAAQVQCFMFYESLSAAVESDRKWPTMYYSEPYTKLRGINKVNSQTLFPPQVWKCCNTRESIAVKVRGGKLNGEVQGNLKKVVEAWDALPLVVDEMDTIVVFKMILDRYMEVQGIGDGSCTGS